MMFMNDYDIETAARQFHGDPVMGPVTRFLRAFMREVNSHSDGWAYWRPPLLACKQLMMLIQREEKRHRDNWPPSEPVTMAEVKKAMGPIKAFMTKRGNAAGMTLPPLE
jgi:hypothetical protein